MEKYSSGRRGAPAKGIGRVTGARVQIPPSPFFTTRYFAEDIEVRCGSVVKRLRHRPFTAVTRVRFPSESFCILTDAIGIIIMQMLVVMDYPIDRTCEYGAIAKW